MCRLFAQISRKPESAFDYLAGGKTSLLNQSDCNPKHLQKDGWGMAVWERMRWKTLRSPRPVFREKARFKEASQKAESKLILAHIRHASNPKKLPRESVLGLDNTQPFTFRNLALAHNGTLNIAGEVARSLGAFQSKIEGNNDSEVLFWLFVKLWERGDEIRDWQRFFNRLTGKIASVWNAIPKNKRKFKAPWRGLNCIVSNGKSLAALCCYDKPEGKALCGQGTPYFQMVYQESDQRVVVASEPTDDPGNWKAIPNKHVLIAGEDGRTHLRRIN